MKNFNNYHNIIFKYKEVEKPHEASQQITTHHPVWRGQASAIATLFVGGKPLQLPGKTRVLSAAKQDVQGFSCLLFRFVFINAKMILDSAKYILTLSWFKSSHTIVYLGYTKMSYGNTKDKR